VGSVFLLEQKIKMPKVHDGMCMPFHYVLNASTAANVYGFAMQPSTNFGTRILAEADAWTLFRMKSLKFRLLPAGTNNFAACYVPGVQDTPPATLAQVVELESAVYLSAPQTSPTNWSSVGKADLQGAIPWYHSIPGGPTSVEEAPGTFVVACSAAVAAFFLEIRGVIEFKGAAAIGNTPMALAAIRTLREEQRRLRDDRIRNDLVKALSKTPGP